jgi:hypothetical protein
MVSFGLWTGCSKDSTSNSYTPTCDGTVKSYLSDVAPVIQSACSGCHQNYSSYSQLYASRGSVRSVIVSGSMPRGSSLSTAQKDAIVCWIDNGAANN